MIRLIEIWLNSPSVLSRRDRIVILLAMAVTIGSALVSAVVWYA